MVKFARKKCPVKSIFLSLIINLVVPIYKLVYNISCKKENQIILQNININ